MIELVKKVALKVDKLEENIFEIKRKLDFKTWPKNEVFQKGVFYLKNGQFETAKRMLQYLYKIKYNPAASLYYLGEIEYRQGKYKKALSYYKKSITLYPNLLNLQQNFYITLDIALKSWVIKN